MENKYYTPTAKEFHIGFEYEFLDEDEDWISATVDGYEEIYHIVRDLFNDLKLVRVKYLDKEDIESLGFIQDEKINTKFHLKNKSKDYFIKDENVYTITLLEILSIPHVIIKYNIDGVRVKFDGKIKNKSELITLLKQLGI